MRQAMLAQNGKPAAATQNGSDLQEHFAFLQLRDGTVDREEYQSAHISVANQRFN
jgi:hypothetical protein